jgi:hypothetical protein
LKKGISLIVLVITIIVIIILAGSVILSLSKNNPILSAEEATFKMTLDSYNSQLTLAISNKYVTDVTFNPDIFNANTWDGSGNVSGTVKECIPSITSDDGANYVVSQGKLFYIGTDINKKKWTQELGITDGLVLYLDANNINSYPGSGTIWNDMSGNNNNGVLVNNPIYNSGNGGSIMFDGIDDYVSVPNTSSLWSSNSFTLEIWAKSVGNGSAAPRAIILSKDHNYIDYNHTSTTMTSLYSMSSSQYLTYGNIPPPLNTWRHYVYTYDGITSKIYENGVLTGSSALSIVVRKTTAPLIIGKFDEGNYNLNGNISIVQVYSRAILAQEVQKNYNASKNRYGL